MFLTEPGGRAHDVGYRRGRRELPPGLIELAKYAVIIEKHYQRPMDIEWGKDGRDGKLFILQARPETVKSQGHGKVEQRFKLRGQSQVLATGRAIAQRTPTRVAHRRSDLVRSRRIVDARIVEASEGRYALELRAEAGTYIKEWAEGDGGRTEPSLAGLLGTPVKVEFLDVVEIHDQEA